MSKLYRHPERTLSSRLFQRIDASAAREADRCRVPPGLDGLVPEGEWRAIPVPLSANAAAFGRVASMVEQGVIPVSARGPVLVRFRREKEHKNGRLLHLDAIGADGFFCDLTVAVPTDGPAWYAASGTAEGSRASASEPDAELFAECSSARPRVENVEKLLRQGASPDAAGELPGPVRENASCLTAMLCRPDGSDFADCTARLLGAGADPNAPTSVTHRTAALFAVAYDKMDSLRLLLAAGADPNALAWDPQFASPLRMAILAGSHLKHKYLEALFAAGARFDLNDCLGMTAIHFAVARKDLASMRAMLLLGMPQAVDVVADASGMTPLQSAIATWGDLDAVRLLLAHGARPTAAGRHNLNALHTAAARAHSAAASLLVRAGCPADARSVHGETPADLYFRLHGAMPPDWVAILGTHGAL